MPQIVEVHSVMVEHLELNYIVNFYLEKYHGFLCVPVLPRC